MIRKKIGDLGVVLLVAFGVVSCVVMSAGIFAYSICLIFEAAFGL